MSVISSDANTFTPMLSVESLLQAFNQLLRTSDRKSSLVIEKQKLLMIEQMLANLKLDAPSVFPTVVEKEVEDTHIKKKLRRTLYYILLVFGVLEDAANGFFFGSALFSLIPAITNYTLFIASVTYACVESVLFYLYDAAELKDALGITDPHTKLSPFIELYSQQIKMAAELNQHLALISSLHIASDQYAHYVKFVSLLNQDLKKKHDIMNNTQESWLKKGIRMSVFAFGSISSLAGSYFMATTVMIFFCPFLISTPIGVSIILATMVIGIVFHYAMDTTSMTRIVNPDYDKYQALKKDMSHFNETYSENLILLQSLRRQFEKKKMVDGSTQTQPNDAKLSGDPSLIQHQCVVEMDSRFRGKDSPKRLNLVSLQTELNEVYQQKKPEIFPSREIPDQNMKYQQTLAKHSIFAPAVVSSQTEKTMSPM